MLAGVQGCLIRGHTITRSQNEANRGLVQLSLKQESSYSLEWERQRRETKQSKSWVERGWKGHDCSIFSPKGRLPEVEDWIWEVKCLCRSTSEQNGYIFCQWVRSNGLSFVICTGSIYRKCVKMTTNFSLYSRARVWCSKWPFVPKLWKTPWTCLLRPWSGIYFYLTL